jgi:HAD superfamily hydrolase (TIGR01509 family)
VTTLIFDCDGVLADTELQGHLPAFNATFAEAGLPVQWSDDEYVGLLRVGGGKERMKKSLGPLLRSRGVTTEDEITAVIQQLHEQKTQRYTELVRSGAVPPRAGVRRLAEQANAAGWQLAVASTSAEASVRAVLESVMGSDLAGHFAIFAGDAAQKKKPSPDIYLLAMSELGATVGNTVVIEDSGIGLAAARAAGLPTVVTVCPSTAHDDFSEAQLVVSSLGNPGEEGPTVISNPLNVLVKDYIDVDVMERIIAGHWVEVPR